MSRSSDVQREDAAWWRRENPWPYVYVACLQMAVGSVFALLLGWWVVAFFGAGIFLAAVLGLTWHQRRRDVFGRHLSSDQEDQS